MYVKTKILLCASLLMLIFALSTQFGTYKDIPLDDIKSNVLSITDTSKLADGNNKLLKRFYGLNSDDYQECVLCVPASNMDVNELLIIKVKDKSQISAIEDSINNRIDSQENSFKDYAPVQYGIIKQNEISIKGNYVFFAISEDAQNMKQQFLKSIK